MILTKGKSTYSLPKYHEIYSVCIMHKKVLYKLQQRDIDFGLPTLTKGIPTSFSLYKNQIEFYPIPDKNYSANIKFTIMKCK